MSKLFINKKAINKNLIIFKNDCFKKGEKTIVSITTNTILIILERFTFLLTQQKF